jgi:amino acid adenylation domain-containing protein/non-ribosomal peptide synthase protein (TIGR01720 family)
METIEGFGASTEAAPSEDSRDRFPLSDHQQRLLASDPSGPSTPFPASVQNIPLALLLQGPLRADWLEESLNAVIDRHEALRTRILGEPGHESQVVAPGTRLQLRIVPLPRGEEASMPVASALETALQRARQPFDPKNELPVRAELIGISDHHSLCVITTSHLFADRRSLDLIAAEMAALYRAKARGASPQLPPVRLQYRDFVRWQRSLTDEVMEPLFFYWRRQLGGGKLARLETSSLARERAKDEVGYARVGFSFNPSVVRKIQEVSAGNPDAVRAFLLAGMTALFHRYTGQREIVLGHLAPCRERSELAFMVGPIANPLVLRNRVEADPSFRGLFEKTTKLLSQARRHQDLPLGRLLKGLFGEGAAGTVPFDVLFELEEDQPSSWDMGDVRAEALETNLGYGGPGLHLFIGRRRAAPGSGEEGESADSASDRWLATLTYDSGRYDDFLIARWMRHFHTLLEEVIAGLDRKVGDLRFLGDEELHQQIVLWNPPPPVYPSNATIHDLFERQASARSHSVALTCGDGQMSYGELDSRAEQVARRLRGLPVNLDEPVAICLERSPELVVGILGILKAGGAYLPLDADDPDERHRFMLADTGSRIVLTRRSLAPRLAEMVRHLICLDDDRIAVGEASRPAAPIRMSGSPAGRASCDNVAYVMYTSGSTGRPKGVSIPHRAVVRLLFGADYVPFDENLTALHLSSTSFDASTFELWGPLLHGGRCVLAAERLPSAADLGEQVARFQINTLWLTASLFNAVVDEMPEAMAGISQLLVGGEALSVPHIRRAIELLPGTKIVNGYGPTESTTFTCCHRITPDEDLGRASIPIGRPVSDTRVYVLDSRLEPVPVGIPGELYIGGAGLARGYVRRPALTAERFLPHAFDRGPGLRWYRTGDLVRWLPSGRLEFLGRVDDQVKIRGYRIEPGEIEEVLAEHPGVQQAVVVVREDLPGRKQLVGYVVVPPEAVPRPTNADLKAHVESRLPAYMVPSALLFLDQLPINASGKVDRRALPPPWSARPELDAAYVAPRTLLEQQLARIWADVLRVDRVGIHDNFFQLGGDSILAIQVVARAHQRQLRITPQKVFQFQTIAELARVVDEGIAVEADQEPVTGPVPLTPIQKWFFDQDLPNPHHFNQALLLEVPSLNRDHLRRVVGELMAHHDALRSRFRKPAGKGPERELWEQYIPGPHQDPKALPLSHIDLAELREPERKTALERAAAELQSSLHLEQGPILRIGLFRTGAESDRLLVLVHHLAIDGVSWRILLEDLMCGFQQLAMGHQPRLPPKTTSFQRWSERLQELARSDALLEERDYWREVLEGPVPPLPRDFAAGIAANEVGGSRSVRRSLGPLETAGLLREAPKAYRTRVDDILLAALSDVLTRWTGQSSVLVDLEGHGRERLFDELDLSRTVGWFTAIYPVKLTGAHPQGDGLKAIKEQLRRVPRRGIGYGILRYLRRDPDLDQSSSVHAEVAFNYLGQLDAALPGATSAGETTPQMQPSNGPTPPADLLSAWRKTLRPASESYGLTKSSSARRAHLLDITAAVAGDQLHVTWSYSPNVHDRSTIEQLAEAYVDALRWWIHHCQSPEAGGCTPSDFPLAKLDQVTLDRLIGDGRAVEDLYPLSPLQEGLLFHSLYAPGGGEYFEQMSATLSGRIDLAAFRRAWQTAVDRWAILRTGFLTEKELSRPLQVVYRKAELSWRVCDLRELSGSDQLRQREAVVAADWRLGFTLSRPPLMRLTLIPLSSEAVILIWTFHHLLLDGWSISLLLREVMLQYMGQVRGHRLALDPPVAYREYIEWLSRQDGERAEQYWRRTLRGLAAPTSLRSLQSTISLAADEHDFEGHQTTFSPEVTGRLSSLARRQRLSMATVVQGLWAVLLSRYAGERDVIFGAATSGRPPQVPGVESTVGMFINTLPVRARVRPSASLVPWLGEIQEQQAETRELEYSSLVDIHRWSELPRGVPLFEVAFAFQNFPIDRSLGDAGGRQGFQLTEIRTRERFTYGITLQSGIAGDVLWLRVMYDRRRYSERTITRLLAHLRNLVEAVAAEPHRRIGDLPLLSALERKELVVERNETRRAFPVESCIHELFERQVRATPEAIALVLGDRQLSYQDLDLRANRLSRHLRASGLDCESRVGICMERSLEMVIGMLGVLKAGAAYVPLDPQYPIQRLSFMLEDAQAFVLLTQSALLERIDTSACFLVICLDQHWGDLPAGGGARSPGGTGPTPQNLAYVIYTSGTTGRPKGALLEHRGAVNLAMVQQRAFGVGAGSRVLQFASSSYDASVWEFLMALASGAALCLADRDSLLPGSDLEQLLREQAITIVTLPPSVLGALEDEEFPALSTIVAAGERCSAELVSRWSAGRRFFNAYGPTESTVCATLQLCGVEPGITPPIGTPIDNAETYILDADQDPVPQEVPGELCLGGVGLARGYAGRPEVTAERFIPHPFSSSPGERLYRTGDGSRWREAGGIEFLGRLDHQVKLRGFRIEPGEIEAVLEEHAAVQQAAVVVREDPSGNPCLLGYVVLDLDREVEQAERFAGGESSDQVAQWLMLYENTFQAAGKARSEATFNTYGWQSSYSGEPISPEEMREWRDGRVDRILALRPQRVLEIGCGTGLLLFPIAPNCLHYHATDFAQAALDFVESNLPDELRSRVTLHHSMADEIQGLDQEEPFDLVILNSVAQYFPSARYLEQVLQSAIGLVRAGGFLFIGDVRNRELLSAFHADVQLSRASAALSTDELARRLRWQAFQENELLVDPRFFQSLPQRMGRIAQVEIQLERGRIHNELTRFRYDVILRMGEPAPASIEPPSIDWTRSQSTVASLRRQLTEEHPESLTVLSVPNARTARALKALDLLTSAGGPRTVGELRRALQQPLAAVDPEELWAFGELGYEVDIHWSAAGGPGSFDAVFRRAGSAPCASVPAARELEGSVSAYTNNPLQGVLVHQRIPELREYLRKRLPEHMLPSAITVLPGLPLTANGKVDRSTLPAPSGTRPETEQAFVGPRTPTEEKIAAVWREVLGLDRIGIHESFFDLGGHSLLATQVISRLRGSFGVELPLRKLFDAPTVAGLAKLIEAGSGEGDAPPIERVPRDRPLPLSFAQERLWFLDRLMPGSALYNSRIPIRVTGAIRIDLLRRAFTEIIRRHEVLRTTFATLEGQAVQIISESPRVTIPVLDLRGLEGDRREKTLQSLVDEDARRPFDLVRGPLIRMCVIGLGEREQAVILSMHHVVADGWSVGVLIREMAALYMAFESGQPSPLPELPIQYADFARWQREWLQGEVLERQLAYWQRELADLPLLQLPTDYPRPVIQSFAGGSVPVALSVPLTRSLRELAHREDCTLFMTLLAGWSALLSRYSGQQEVVVGSPIAGRTRAETEALIGFFVNNLVLRTDLGGDPGFLELLRRVREVTLGAFAHQDLPFEKLVDAIRPERDLSRSPLFQVMFVLQNAPMPAVDLPGALSLKPVPVNHGTAKFDLTLMLWDGGEQLSGSIEYNASLFSVETIGRMVLHLAALLQGIVESPSRPLSRLPLLPDAERTQLLFAWNDTGTDYPQNDCLHDRFANQAARTPDAVALVHGEGHLTYGELARRAQLLAWHLIGLGVASEERVGVCVGRSPEMVIAILGVLQSGAAYVPMEPGYPVQRLAFMMEDAGISVLLTEERFDQVPAPPAVPVVRLDRDWGKIAEKPAMPPAAATAASSLAYLIYTSGSTGRPKGVAITHGNAVALLHWARDAFSPSELAGVLASTSICFDLSAFELFVPLSWGGTVVLVEHALQWTDLPSAGRVTLINSVPSVVRELLRRGPLPPGVRTVNLAGEPLPPALVDQLYSCPGVERVHDLYGPTETTTYSTCAIRPAQGPATIGRPLSNTRAYVLDREFEPVPVGVIAELFLAGAGVARGYWKRPELTAQRFVPEPHAAAPGARMYRTGDQARWRSSRMLEFCGRMDDQVKIRGFRIELGEIQSELEKLDAVQEAAVLARAASAGEHRLEAYIVPRVTGEGVPPTPAAWAGHLRERLPAYMIPAAYVALESIPRTPSGKVDRRALSAIGEVRRWSSLEPVPPRDERERQLAHIWEELLEVRPIGMFDSFFELGGHSFLALRLLSLIEQQFGQSLPPAVLFQRDTIAEIAAALGRAASTHSASNLVMMHPSGSGRPLFLVHPAGGSVLSYVALTRHLSAEQPVYGLEAVGLEGREEPPTTVEEMARRYLISVRTVQPEGPYLLGGHSSGGIIAFEMARQLVKSGESVGMLALFDSPAPRLYRARFGNADPPADRADARLRPVLLATHRAILAYDPPSNFAPGVTLFLADDTDRTGDPGGGHRSDIDMGWRELVGERVRISFVSGDHFTMLRLPHVEKLARPLQQCIDSAI